VKRLLLSLGMALAILASNDLLAGVWCEDHKSLTSHFECGADGNCVWWAAYKRPDLAVARITDSGGAWLRNAENLGFRTGDDPQEDAIVEFSTPGHVAYVSNVNGDNFTVTEMNWEATNPNFYDPTLPRYDTSVTYYRGANNTYHRGTDRGNNVQGSYALSGFIYSSQTKIEWAGKGKCLDVQGGNRANGTRAQIWDCGGDNPIHFNRRFFAPHNGTGPIIWAGQAENTNYCLDVEHGIASNGTPVQFWDCADGGINHPNRQWEMPDDGTGYIRWDTHPEFCLDVRHGDTANGTPFQIWRCNDGPQNHPNRMFQVAYPNGNQGYVTPGLWTGGGGTTPIGTNPNPIPGKRADLTPKFDVEDKAGNELSATCRDCETKPLRPNQQVDLLCIAETANDKTENHKRDKGSQSIECVIWYRMGSGDTWKEAIPRNDEKSPEMTISKLRPGNDIKDTAGWRIPDAPGQPLHLTACIDADDEIYEEGEGSRKKVFLTFYGILATLNHKLLFTYRG